MHKHEPKCLLPSHGCLALTDLRRDAWRGRFDCITAVIHGAGAARGAQDTRAPAGARAVALGRALHGAPQARELARAGGPRMHHVRGRHPAAGQLARRRVRLRAWKATLSTDPGAGSQAQG